MRPTPKLACLLFAMSRQVSMSGITVLQPLRMVTDYTAGSVCLVFGVTEGWQTLVDW